MPPTRRSSAQTRDHILDVAADLFYWRGIHATGVDTVATEAGVAPTTLYRTFGSKDGLVAAYVELAAERYRQRWTQAVAGTESDPATRVLALFDQLVDEVDPADCRGCLFLLTVAEIPDPGHPAHAAVREVKEWTRSVLVGLATQLIDNHDDGREFGEELALLVEGVYGAVQAQRTQEPARLARRIAQRRLCSLSSQ